MTTAIETKERPILFSGEMVRAILDGRKTQTRRIVKPQPAYGVREIKVGMFEPVIIRGGMEEPGKPVFGFADEERGWKCKYGQPGDRLWVRETWLEFDSDHRIGGARYTYKADVSVDGELIRKDYIKCGRDYRWKPSIHMPRNASRITLEITGVRVQRLQDIRYDDCLAEGWHAACGIGADYWYKELWDKINGWNSWNENPWVWVVEFKRVIAA